MGRIYFIYTFSLLLFLGINEATAGNTKNYICCALSDSLKVSISDTSYVISDTITPVYDSLVVPIDEDIALPDTTSVGDSVSVSEEVELENKKIKKIDSTYLNMPLISGLDIYVDYGKLLFIPTQYEKKYEFGAGLRFKGRYELMAEAGSAELDPNKAFDNVRYYTIKGNYFRFGADYYTALDEDSHIYFGLRYGLSNFEDEGVFVLGSDFWNSYGETFGSKDVTASWGEFVFGSETCLKVGKKNVEEGTKKTSPLMIGMVIRLRVLFDFENREVIKIYAIPGYGRTLDKSVPAFNFYLKYRIGK